MNQILVSDKVYVTPELLKKKKRYKKIFSLSLVLVILFFSYYLYSENERNKSEAISQEILKGISFGIDTQAQNDVLLISLNESNGTNVVEDLDNIDIQTSNRYVSSNGVEYIVDSILTIPSLEIEYPVLSETSDELLEISVNKFWGVGPNKIGNYCIVGHNYKNGKMFGKLNKINAGDIIELKDSKGLIIKYAVYNKFVVEPTDLSCTSQITNGKKEVTLITCINSGDRKSVV